MKRSSTTNRLRHRHLPWVLTALGCGVVVLLVCWIIRIMTVSTPWRQTIVLVSDPMHIVSWDATKNHVVVVDVPAATQIEGTHGYGLYPIESLYSLDDIDGRQGVVYLDSISDAFGLPITGFVRRHQSMDGAGSIDLVRSVFSWRSLFQFRARQGISFDTWVSYVLAALSLKTDAVELVSADGAIVSQDRPDGSIARVLDPQRFDFLFGKLFVDSSIRQEGITVAVYNTTAVSTIGQRAARILTTMGVSVITVGNDSETVLPRCRLSGPKKIFASLTAQFIHRYFYCEDVVVESESIGGADLVVRLGRDYADIFGLPK